MKEADADPFADQPKRWVGCRCSFEQDGKTYVGTIEAHTWAGRTPQGNRPDYQVTVRGASGRTMTVSMDATHLSIL